MCVCVYIHTPHLYPFFSWWTFRIFMSILHTDLKCTDPHVDNHRMTINQTAILLKRTFEFMVVIMILNLAPLTSQQYGLIWRTNVQKYFLKRKETQQVITETLHFFNVPECSIYNSVHWKYRGMKKCASFSFLLRDVSSFSFPPIILLSG